MKFLIYFIAFLIAVITSTIVNELNVAYAIAVELAPYDSDKMVLIAGLLSLIFTVLSYGVPFYFARRISRNRDEATEFKKCVADSGMSKFEYAKSITPKKVISYCDSHFDRELYKVVVTLDELPSSKVISRPCADALIEGYAELVEQSRKEASNNDRALDKQNIN